MPHKILRCNKFLFAAFILLSGTFSAYAAAGFTFQAGCNGTITFSAIAQGSASYYWGFGDSSGAGSQNTDSGLVVTHQFAKPGTYLVTLQIQANGNGTIYSQQVFVGPFVQQQISGPDTVCAGSSHTFTLAHDTAGFQYTWLVSNGQIIGSSSSSQAQVLFSAAGTAVVSVIISNGAGCDSILNQTVQVFGIPQLILPGGSKSPGGSNDSGQASGYCQNAYVWLYALSSAPGIITWSSGTGITKSPQGSDSMLFFFPTAGSTYVQAIEAGAGGCSDTVSIAVTVLPQPVVTVSAGNTCLGTANAFAAVPTAGSGALTYQWTFDDGSTATGIEANHTFATAGTYSAQLVATNQNGCTDTVISSVSIDAHPGPAISCAGPVCSGSTQTYSVPPVSGASYHWTVTGGTIVSGGSLTDNTVEITWGSNGVGTIEVYLSGAGIYCQFPTVQNIPILGGSQTIQGSTAPCLYTNTSYSVPFVPGGVYNWTVSGSASIVSGQGTNQVQITFYSSPVTVSVSISHQILSCSSNASLVVNPVPSFAVYGAATACAGIQNTFNAFPSAAFTWTVQGGTILSGNGTNNITVLWDTAGKYTVTANMPTGFCNTQSQISVNVVNRKTESIQGNNQACVGSTSPYTVSPGATSYAWSVQGGTIAGGYNYSNIAEVTWTTPGTDTLKLIYADANYCLDTAYFVVAVSGQDVPAFTGDTVTCYNNTVVYTYPNTPGFSYTWQTDGGIVTSGQNTNSVSVQWVGNQLGTIRLKNTACNTFQQKNIVIRPTPLVNFDTANLTCSGSSVDIGVVQDYPSYIWSNALSTQSIHITSAGNYTVTVGDALGCTASATAKLNPLPNNNFSVAYIAVTFPPPPIPFSYLYLTAVGIPNPVSYIWNTGNTEATQYAQFANTYTVTMTDQFGCTTSLSMVVSDSSGITTAFFHILSYAFVCCKSTLYDFSVILWMHQNAPK
jgi:PKD repeat protein